MRTILHILTKPKDDLVTKVIDRQQALPETRVETVDLSSGDPDYRAAVERIFSADSVEVW
jgi:hypothetical protein